MIDVIRVKVVDPSALHIEALEVDSEGKETGRRFDVESWPRSLRFDWAAVNDAYVGDTGKVNIIIL